MPVLIKAGETDSGRREVEFDVRLSFDGMSPATAEAGGQPQIRVTGGSWTNVGIGVLASVGNGRYVATLATAILATAGLRIMTRYKGTDTAETPGDSFQVVGFDPTSLQLPADGLDLIVVESGINARQALSPILASAAGKLTGAGTGTILVKGGNNTTTRIAATTDGAGNRTAVTLTLPT